MEQDINPPRLSRLADPLFILALAVLLLNDHVWKAAFHNSLTGKLSDFAGLYAFVWVGLALLPRGNTLRYGVNTLWVLFAGLFFAWWKSPLSQPAIDTWNAIGPFTIGRVIDYTDLLAMAVLPLAGLRHASTLPRHRHIPNIAHYALLAIALFAFAATSQKENYTYKESYNLPGTPQQIIAKLNAINQRDSLGNPVLSLHHQNANDFRQEDDFRLYLHHNKEKVVHYDTVWVRIDSLDSNIIHEIRPYEVPLIDSMYINPEGIFEWQFDVKFASQDTTQRCNLPAVLRLNPKGTGSQLDLLQIRREKCILAEERHGKTRPEDILKITFEEQVIKPLKGN